MNWLALKETIGEGYKSSSTLKVALNFAVVKKGWASGKDIEVEKDLKHSMTGILILN